MLTKSTQLFEREAQQRTRDQADLDWLLGAYDCISSSNMP